MLKGKALFYFTLSGEKMCRGVLPIIIGIVIIIIFLYWSEIESTSLGLHT